jgi:Mg2+-importing ATPase
LAFCLLFAISVAVGLTPEMLPMIVTSAASPKGAIAMGKKKVIIKNINSIQNFGAIDVLCTDKTGNFDSRSRRFGGPLERQWRHRLSRASSCLLELLFPNRIKEPHGSVHHQQEPGSFPPNIRLLQNLDSIFTKVDEVPFDFARKRMSVVVKDASGKTQMITKGALERFWRFPAMPTRSAMASCR